MKNQIIAGVLAAGMAAAALAPGSAVYAATVPKETGKEVESFADDVAELPDDNRLIVTLADEETDAGALSPDADAVQMGDTAILSFASEEACAEAKAELAASDSILDVAEDAEFTISSDLVEVSAQDEPDLYFLDADGNRVPAYSADPVKDGSADPSISKDELKAVIDTGLEEGVPLMSDTPSEAEAEETAETEASAESSAAEDTAAPDAADERSYVIALIDTGADGMDTVDFTGEGTEDENGHGTRMARAILDGADGHAEILSLKALGKNGRGKLSNITAAVRYAVDAGADVISLSLSARYREDMDVLGDLLSEAVTEDGVKVVAAAGNYGADASAYFPACLSSALVIGACDASGERISTSDFGSTVDYYAAAGSTSEAAALFTGKLAAGGLSDTSLPDNAVIFLSDGAEGIRESDPASDAAAREVPDESADPDAAFAVQDSCIGDLSSQLAKKDVICEILNATYNMAGSNSYWDELYLITARRGNTSTEVNVTNPLVRSGGRPGTFLSIYKDPRSYFTNAGGETSYTDETRGWWIIKSVPGKGCIIEDVHFGGVLSADPESKEVTEDTFRGREGQYWNIELLEDRFPGAASHSDADVLPYAYTISTVIGGKNWYLFNPWDADGGSYNSRYNLNTYYDGTYTLCDEASFKAAVETSGQRQCMYVWEFDDSKIYGLNSGRTIITSSPAYTNVIVNQAEGYPERIYQAKYSTEMKYYNGEEGGPKTSCYYYADEGYDATPTLITGHLKNQQNITMPAVFPDNFNAKGESQSGHIYEVVRYAGKYRGEYMDCRITFFWNAEKAESEGSIMAGGICGSDSGFLGFTFLGIPFEMKFEFYKHSDDGALCEKLKPAGFTVNIQDIDSLQLFWFDREKTHANVDGRYCSWDANFFEKDLNGREYYYPFYADSGNTSESSVVLQLSDVDDFVIGCGYPYGDLRVGSEEDLLTNETAGYNAYFRRGWTMDAKEAAESNPGGEKRYKSYAGWGFITNYAWGITYPTLTKYVKGDAYTAWKTEAALDGESPSVSYRLELSVPVMPDSQHYDSCEVSDILPPYLSVTSLPEVSGWSVKSEKMADGTHLVITADDPSAISSDTVYSFDVGAVLDPEGLKQAFASDPLLIDLDGDGDEEKTGADGKVTEKSWKRSVTDALGIEEAYSAIRKMKTHVKDEKDMDTVTLHFPNTAEVSTGVTLASGPDSETTASNPASVSYSYETENKDAGDVILKKTASGEPDAEKMYVFALSLVDKDGASVTDAHGDVTFDADGKAEVSLKSGEEKRIEDIPRDSVLTVTEKDTAAYDVTIRAGSEAKVTGDKIDYQIKEREAEIEFTNKKKIVGDADVFKQNERQSYNIRESPDPGSTWEIIGTIPENIEVPDGVYQISDALDDRLDLISDSIAASICHASVAEGKVVCGEKISDLVKDADYTASYDEASRTLSIELTAEGRAKMAKALAKRNDESDVPVVRIGFDTMINSTAKGGEHIENDVKLAFGNSTPGTDPGIREKTPEEKPYVYTGSIAVKKLEAEGDPLSGAVFGLYLDAEGKQPVCYKDGSVFTDGAGGDPWKETTGEDGSLLFNGVKDGTYYLREEQAPEGFSLLAESIAVEVKDGKAYPDGSELSDSTVRIDEHQNIKVLNAGGSGIHLAVRIAAIIALAAAAAVVFAASKRSRR